MPRKITPGSATANSPGARPPASETREKILHIALDHFTRKGYAETSLREIADELGFSKAALYYHFKSKEDILLALHLRAHHLIDEVQPLLKLTGGGDEVWEQIVDGLIGIALRNRQLMEFHVRNQEAIQSLHTHESIEKHGDAPHDMDEQVLEFMRDPSVPLDVRVRRAASVAAVIGVLIAGNAFSEASDAELEKVLRDVVRDVLGVHSG
jgi:AcrR family transcriptional regulator